MDDPSTSTSSGCDSTTTPDLVVIQVYITSARRAYAIADHYRAPRRLRRARRAARHVAAGRGRARTPTPSSSGPARTRGREFLADFRARAPASAGYESRHAHARRRAADPPRSDQAPAATSCPTRSSSRAAARTSATSATRTRSSRAAGRSTRRRSTTRWPRSTGCPAGTSTSSTTTCSATARFADGAVRRHARHGPALAGARARSTRSCAGDLIEQAADAGPAQPVRRLRDAQRRQPARAAQASEPRPRLRRRDPPAARPRRHDQRQLRLRHGRRRSGRVRADRRLGDRAGHRDRDVPHPDAVSGHGAATQRMAAQDRHAAPRLGSLRHAPRRLPAGAA